MYVCRYLLFPIGLKQKHLRISLYCTWRMCTFQINPIDISVNEYCQLSNYRFGISKLKPPILRNEIGPLRDERLDKVLELELEEPCQLPLEKLDSQNLVWSPAKPTGISPGLCDFTGLYLFLYNFKPVISFSE